MPGIIDPEIVVYEDSHWPHFLPLVYVRPVWHLRCGMWDLLTRIRRVASLPTGADSCGVPGVNVGETRLENRGLAPRSGPTLWCRPELADVVREQTGQPVNAPLSGHALLLNGRGLWRHIPEVRMTDSAWVGTVNDGRDIACVSAESTLAASLSSAVMLDERRLAACLDGLPRRDVSDDVSLFHWPWELIHRNEASIADDWLSVRELAAEDRIASDNNVAEGSYLLAPESIRIGSGSRIKPCVVIDAENGPVWIGDAVKILPHTYIEGPCFIGDGSLIQAGSRIHAGTTLGPRSKVGGEVEASIIHGYSNKQHDGFLGHSYIGSWVNLAADCINSDLKNTYGTVRVPINGRDVETNEIFVGMLVGDYSKAGINTSFPTGTVLGFCSMIFATHSPKFVPSFSWINGPDREPYDVTRALLMARRMMSRREKAISPILESLFQHISQQSAEIELVASNRSTPSR